jgi:hypothetical protein
VTRQLIAHIGDTGADARRQHARNLLGQLSEREREVAIAVGTASPTLRSAATCA